MSNVTITAELGTAWRGDFTLLKKLMKQCKEADVNAVKLQAFRSEHLSKRFDRLISSVTEANVETIDSIAKEVRILWYCTPCYPQAVEFLDPFVNCYKIRYKDRHNFGLIDRVDETSKKFFMSTDDEICWYDHVVPLYCVSKYPPLPEDVNFKEMEKFSGFSCHLPDKNIILTAIKVAKIKYLELHVKPLGNTGDLMDDPVSFDTIELKYLIKEIREL